MIFKQSCDRCWELTTLRPTRVRLGYGRFDLLLCVGCIQFYRERKAIVGAQLAPIGAQAAPPAGAIVLEPTREMPAHPSSARAPSAEPEQAHAVAAPGPRPKDPGDELVANGSISLTDLRREFPRRLGVRTANDA